MTSPIVLGTTVFEAETLDINKHHLGFLKTKYTIFGLEGGAGEERGGVSGR